MNNVIVARKPLACGTVAANVLKHGCGSLNIDASRISVSGEEAPVMNHSGSADAAVSKGRFGDSIAQETHQTAGQQLGRWPANLILQHLDGCQESVGGWVCQSGCPAAELDGVVGVKSSGAAGAKQESTVGNAGNRSSAYGKESRRAGEMQVGYGDTGMVSRFFKQVGGTVLPTQEETE